MIIKDNSAVEDVKNIRDQNQLCFVHFAFIRSQEWEVKSALRILVCCLYQEHLQC